MHFAAIFVMQICVTHERFFTKEKNTDNNSLPQSVLVLVSCKCPIGIYNQPSASKNTRHAPWVYATQGSRSIVHSSTDISPETSVVQTDVLEQVFMKETQDKRSRMLMVNLQQQTNKQINKQTNKHFNNDVLSTTVSMYYYFYLQSTLALP